MQHFLYVFLNWLVGVSIVIKLLKSILKSEHSERERSDASIYKYISMMYVIK